MNKVQLVGRFTKDPDVRYTESGTSMSKFTIAVDRRYKKENEEQTADFISCVSFGKTAEFVEKYFKKGQRIGLCGRIQTGSYTNNDGQKVYTTDVIAEEVEFVESKSDNKAENKTDTRIVDKDGFINADAALDERLPFN